MRGEFYIDEKQRKKRRRILKLKIYGGLAAFFVLIIGAGYLIIYSPLFKIKKIDAGQNQQIIDEIKNFLTSQSRIASILGEDNILVWRDEKTNEFLKNYPQVAELTIKKDYFERQVKINVKERERFGVWCIQAQINTDETRINADNISENQRKSASCMWFDKNGVIFAEAPAMEGELIKKISDFSGRPLKLGDKAMEENMMKNLIGVFDVLEKSDLKVKNLVLKDLSLQEVVAESPSIPKIYFSLRISPEFALAAIQSLKESGLNKLDYIDFRVENRAYYKLK